MTTEINNSFVVLLTELQNGAAVHKLSEKISEVVSAVKNRNASGELTLKLKLKPRNEGRAVEVEPTITAKMPKEPTLTTFLYVTEDNRLQRNDPDQRMLPLRELPREEEPLREAL